MSWEFFWAMYYGVILGILGNTVVELFFQRFYPQGMPRRAAEIGIVATILVIIIGFICVLWASAAV